MSAEIGTSGVDSTRASSVRGDKYSITRLYIIEDLQRMMHITVIYLLKLVGSLITFVLGSKV